jgi:hypothetical protein
MTVHKLDPLTDSRWPEFLARHPEASIFHTQSWLKALHLTYGYKPVLFTTSDGPELSNGVVFCEIKSWVTGRRLVSVPFSDHCHPLAGGSDCQAILESLHRDRGTAGWRYIELRPVLDDGVISTQADFGNSNTFSFQKVDLRPDVETIYRGFHDSCVRRKIKRAEREKLAYQAGRSEELLENFWRLLLLTRRRHKLPPQPAVWFRNLMDCLGDSLTIHVVSKGVRPIASIVTLTYKKSLIYKYGCSDAQFHSMGGIPLLFWNVIQEGKRMGIEDFDLGRSAYDDPGLIAFKEHLGAVTSELRYYRNPPSPVKEKASDSATSWGRNALARLPDAVLVGAGRLLYRHLG